MNTMKFVDCITLAGTTIKPFEGRRYYLSTGALKGNSINTDELVEVTYENRPSRASIDVAIGDIVFAKMMSTVKVLEITEETKDLIVSTGFYVVRPAEGFDNEFIYQYLNTKEFNDQKDKNCTGATQKALTNVGLNKIEIPVFDYETQVKIGRSLALARRAIDKRHEQISVLDRACMETFIDMFGKENAEESQFTLADVCDEIYRYPTFYGFAYQEKGIPVVKIGNILKNGILDDNLCNYNFISEDIDVQFPRTKLKLYDSVMAVRGDGSTAKRIGIVYSKNLVGANISPNLLRFSANEEICTPFYLYYFLISSVGQRMLEKFITRTAKKTITATNIKTIPIPVPPLEEQKKFQSIIFMFERQKNKLERSLFELEATYNSIVQRVFRGQLF